MGGNKYDDEESKKHDAPVGDKPAEPTDAVKEPPSQESST
jgi:hypothetical protein